MLRLSLVLQLIYLNTLATNGLMLVNDSTLTHYGRNSNSPKNCFCRIWKMLLGITNYLLQHILDMIYSLWYISYLYLQILWKPVALIHDVNSIDWNISISRIDNNICLLKEYVASLYNKHVPVVEKIKKPFKNHCMNITIYRLLEKRRKGYSFWKKNRSNTAWSTFVKIRNQAVTKIRRAKRQYLNSKLVINLSSKELLRNLSNLGVTKSKDDECLDA